MKQLFCPATGQLELIEAPVPAIGPGELLIRLVACGLCGTDLMKVYDDRVPKPVQLGHELVGVVAEVGAGVERFSLGQRVAAAHHVPDPGSHYTRRGSAPMDPAFKRSNIDPGGFAEFIRLPAAHVAQVALPLPDDLPDLRAVFLEPLACCLRALDRVPVLEGDTVLVIGVGAVGMLFVPLLCDRSAVVMAVDVRRSQVEAAASWGAAAGFVAGEDAVVDGVRGLTEGRGVDRVIVTALSQATLRLALAALRDGGTLVLFGAKPEMLLAVDLWEVWRRELNIVSSYSATPDLFPRALAILRRPSYAFERTISHALPLAAAADGFQLAHSGQAAKVVVIP